MNECSQADTVIESYYSRYTCPWWVVCNIRYSPGEWASIPLLSSLYQI